MSKHNIFVVDDESIIVLELRQRILELGYAFAGSAGEGYTAIDQISRIRPDLVLMDINISGNIDGIETAKIILSKYQVPIIYLTAYTDSETLERVKQTSPYGFIIKPADEKELYVAIEIALSKSRMEQKIRENEKSLLTTLNSIGDGVITTDNTGRIKRINPAASEITGWKAEEAAGLYTKEIFTLLEPKERKKVKCPVKLALETGNTISREQHSILTRKDISERYISYSAAPIIDEFNEIEGVVLVFSDETESYKNRQKLIESEKKYRTTIENATDMIYATDISGNLRDINIAGLKIVGFARKEIIGKNVLDLIAPSHRNRIKRHLFRQYIDKIKTSYLEAPIKKKDGSLIWIGQNTDLVLDGNRVEGFHVIARNITQRKEAEFEYKKSREMLRKIIDTIPDMIFLKDKSGKFLLNNKAHLESMGFIDQKEALGKTNYDFMTPSLADEYKKEEDRLLEGKIPFIHATESMLDIKGNMKWFNVTKLPYRMSDKGIDAILGVCRDITYFKISEDIIKENNRKFQSLANISPVGIFRTDREGDIVYVNPRWTEITGLQVEDSLGTSWDKIVRKEDLSLLTEALYGSLQTKKALKVDLRLNTLDSTKWIMCNAQPEIDEKNNIIGFVGTISDITERKNTETEILMLADSLRAINDCVTITDIDNNLLFVNQALLNTYDYSREELIGKHISILGSEKNPAGINEVIAEESIRNGWKGELINTRKDGTEFPIQLSTTCILDKDRKPVGLIGVSSDITLRKQNEAELKKLNQAIIQSPVSIIITDKNAKIEYVNAQTCEVTGYSKDELIGSNPKIFSTHEKSEKEYQQLWETITSGKIWRGEFRNRKKNGELFWESNIISPVKDSLGHITHYMAFKQDITKRKELEQNLITAKEKAEAANDVKDAFIANISHEIRTPLNGILGMLSLLKELVADKTDEDETFIFESIGRSSRRIIRTVDLILNYSRLQAGDISSLKENIRIDKIIEENYLDYRGIAQNNGLDFKFENKIGSTHILGDCNYLSLILSNLIDNAIKYTPEGSVVIFLDKNKENFPVIQIKDTGIGISEEYFNKLFEPYTQEESGYTRAYDGVGLGLSLVKEILDIIGGSVEVSSEKGAGTTFSVTIHSQILADLQA